jgi:hypothetical protein
MDVAFFWSQVGSVSDCAPVSPWFAVLPLGERPIDPTGYQMRLNEWRPEFGYLCQELMFIGINVNWAQFLARLDACVLTEQEFALGERGWVSFPDPFLVIEHPTDPLS